MGQYPAPTAADEQRPVPDDVLVSLGGAQGPPVPGSAGDDRQTEKPFDREVVVLRPQPSQVIPRSRSVVDGSLR